MTDVVYQKCCVISSVTTHFLSHTGLTLHNNTISFCSKDILCIPQEYFISLLIIFIQYFHGFITSSIHVLCHPSLSVCLPHTMEWNNCPSHHSCSPIYQTGTDKGDQKANVSPNGWRNNIKLITVPLICSLKNLCLIHFLTKSAVFTRILAQLSWSNRRMSLSRSSKICTSAMADSL